MSIPKTPIMIDGVVHWRCSLCGKAKTADDFARRAKAANGLSSDCKRCRAKVKKKYLEKQKSRRKKSTVSSTERAKSSRTRPVTKKPLPLTEKDLRTKRMLASYYQIQRPRTRRDCSETSRPCPWVGCRYHLYLDEGRHGSIKFNFPDIEPWEMDETCALDLACGMPLDEISARLNITGERVRQIIQVAMEKMKVLYDELEVGP